MVYSDVVRQGLILPRKSKYTIADVHSVMVGSLFNRTGTYSHKQAAFIVKCSAIFHETDYSKAVGAVLA